ncbi:tyrosine- kinase Fer isoform X1 [Paramuricea clavata]|uniref:Tyrosine-protein kinase n=2 Tax=Paramuricea clavata TaxID=317549 RepID=A0A6S7GRW5_PARCT|nr:tyrosine- kinase Fer isoform X1 [Paramuricea clavata]
MHMKEAHKLYKTHRFRVDSELKTVRDEENRLKVTYQQHADELESIRQKLEGSKGKTDKTKQDKLKKASLKLYQNHNDYVLALSAATIHQNHYETGIVPNLMNSLQTVKQDLANDWKTILGDITYYIKAYSERYGQLADSINSSMEEVKDDNPYEPFIINNGAPLEQHGDYTFDEALLTITTTDLMANELGLNDLTLEQLKAKNILFEKSVFETKAELSQKSSDYQAAKQTLTELRETSKGSLSSIFLKQMAVTDLSRELKELSCKHEKAVGQHVIVSSALDKLDGGSPLKFTDPLLSASSESFGTNGVMGRTLQRFTSNLVKGLSPTKKERPYTFDSDFQGHSADSHRPLPTRPGVDDDDDDDDDSDADDPDDYDEPVDVPLEDELWYHGMISREETEALLKNGGDYLVRESKRKPGNYVLSAKWDGIRHFIIQQDESGKFRLEGEAYSTVTHLVDFHKKHQCAVTKKSNALLKNPILRPKSTGRKLNHDNIVIETKLGRGHFGDVMKGRLKDTGEEVAVKTCRDNVTSVMRDKFLQEAEILFQYAHPNIVKLIGVVDQEPVYIVMELMVGGDFLNYLRNHGNEIRPQEQLQYGIDAANGMAYLEKHGCIHRDLAARNCLLDKVKILKISDFGMSRETDLYECSNMREIPVKWTAPEALNYTQYTSASDVWSFGVLLWETYSLGNTPYPGKGNKETREQVDRGYRMPPPLGTPTAIYDLMKQCWEYEPKDRPQFRTIRAKLMQIKLLG